MGWYTKTTLLRLIFFPPSILFLAGVPRTQTQLLWPEERSQWEPAPRARAETLFLEQGTVPLWLLPWDAVVLGGQDSVCANGFDRTAIFWSSHGALMCLAPVWAPLQIKQGPHTSSEHLFQAQHPHPNTWGSPASISSPAPESRGSSWSHLQWWSD